MRKLLELAMIALRWIPAFFRSRGKQALVELALRQQLATFSEKGRRPRITPADRGFWVLLSRARSGSSSASPQYLDISRSEIRTVINVDAGARSFGVTGHPTSSWVIQQLREALSNRHSSALPHLRQRFDLLRPGR